MRLKVGLVDVLGNALLEPRQHVLEILLFVTRGLFVRHGHATVLRRKLLLVDHGAEVDEVTFHRGFITHLHLGVFRLDLPLGLRGCRGREHRERRFGALVLGIVLRHPRVHRARLLRQIRAQQRIGELDIGVDQLDLVPRLEGELDGLLPVPHAVWIEPQHFVHEIARVSEIPGILVARRREVELFDTAFPLALLDQRLPQRLVRFRVVRVVCDARFQLLDARRRGRFLDVGKDQRARLIRLAGNLIHAEIDEPGAAADRDRRVVFGLDEFLPRLGRRGRVIDRERLIVHVVPGMRRRRLEVRLEFERRHFNDGLALAGPAGPAGPCHRRRGTLGHDRLHTRRFGGDGPPAAELRLYRRDGRRTLRGWRRRRLDNVALQYQIGLFQSFDFG